METNLLIAPSQNMMMVRSNEWKQDVEEAVLIREQPQKRSPFKHNRGDIRSSQKRMYYTRVF